MTILFGSACTKKISTQKNFYRLSKTYIMDGGTSHFKGKCGNKSGVPLKSSS